MSLFEALMLICFGAGWPVSITKAIRSKEVRGKSPLFMGIIACGYVFGMIHKYYFDMDWVFNLYALNCVMVLVDLTLYFHYRPRVLIQAS